VSAFFTTFIPFELIHADKSPMLVLCCPKTLVDGTSLYFQQGYRAEYFDFTFAMGKDFPAWKQ
jgi:hypothetical protein